jgi:hypothetical protein
MLHTISSPCRIQSHLSRIAGLKRHIATIMIMNHNSAADLFRLRRATFFAGTAEHPRALILGSDPVLWTSLLTAFAVLHVMINQILKRLHSAPKFEPPFLGCRWDATAIVINAFLASLRCARPDLLFCRRQINFCFSRTPVPPVGTLLFRPTSTYLQLIVSQLKTHPG